MPVIKLNDQQYALTPGQHRVGGGADVDIAVATDASLGLQAIVELAHEQVVIRRARDGAVVRVNGIPLVDPTPLMHGDKVEIAGAELLYADDAKSGATQYVSASEIAEIAQKRAGPARATAATGGRLVSLVDGKEYPIPASGVVIGRDASSDVVVAENEVSRRHAEIGPVDRGYEIRDCSANGVFVNGGRVSEAQVLSRADVIRVGSEEFRFYADVAPLAKPTPPAAAPATPATPTAAPSAEPVVAPAGAPGMPSIAARAPAAPSVDGRPVLAVLEITNEGPTKGRAFEIRAPLAHVGRGAHNDVVISDDSVSDAHATLQRRDDAWYVVDAGSTNGTYVTGQRLAAERRLDGAPDVRFGGVKTIFRPRDIAVEANTGTRAIASVDRAQLRPTTAPASRAAPVAAETPSSTGRPGKRGAPVWIWIVVGLLVLAAGGYLLMNH